MSEPTNGKNGTPGAAAQQQPAAPVQVQVQIVGQYIKDLSFENPNVGKLLQGPGESPNLALEINVNAQTKGPDLHETTVEFKAVASNKAGTIYDLELVYAGLFKVQNIPQQALEPFLLIHCASLIFPFLRRLVADISREGGFPPLLLDPVDFAGLYMRRQQQQEAAAKEATKS